MAGRHAAPVDYAHSPNDIVQGSPYLVQADLPASSSRTQDQPTDPAAKPIISLKGVGKKLSESLTRLGISTYGDLLAHYPRRYEDRSRFLRISDLIDGETATILGAVKGVENRPTKSRLVVTRVMIDDGSTSVLMLTFFNQWRLKQTFERLIGKRLIAYGTVKRGFATIEMPQPEWEATDGVGDTLSMGRIVPIYDLTEGIGQKVLRRLVFEAISEIDGTIADSLPADLRNRRQLMPVSDAISAIHFPESQAKLEAARYRLVYDELLIMQLLLVARRDSANRVSGISFGHTESALAEFMEALPFALTGAQARVIREIADDMRAPRPMNRLIQGDVGSGKTAVAIAAMLIAARNGYQSAFMAPTEILAEQQLSVVRDRLENLGVRVDLLTGSRPAREKEAVRQRIASGETGIVIGTHALVQESVTFPRLGLVIIDEQHRFGVLQRAALAGKGARPDVLVMTATPIPRTLSLTVYGDLDVSLIDELPPGRRPIRTHARARADKPSVYEGVRKLLREGRQAYVVCSLVEESDKLQAQAATELAVYLQRQIFPEFKIGLLHGQMGGPEKDKAMGLFRDGATQLLVATTVIEVGVDVPNAAAIVIEDADRFGLAQLHQLRGRVGRGAYASYCVLIADPASEEGRARIKILCDTNDGFQIAEEDLKLRGPGEFYGVRQSGIQSLKIADIIRDVDILALARSDAFRLMSEDPELAQVEHRYFGDIIQRKRPDAELTNIVDIA